MNLAVPTVHLNGTDGDELLSQITDAMDALRKAQAALQRAAPNMRDYYIQGVGEGARASNQAAERYKAIARILTELEFIGEAIADQNDARKAARRP